MIELTFYNVTKIASLMSLSPEYSDAIEEGTDELMTTYESFLNFLRKRFSREGKFGLQLTIGVSLTLFFIFLFFSILQDYRAYDPLVRADTPIVNLIYTLRSQKLNQVMLFFTDIATWQVVFTGIIVASFSLFSLNLLPYLFALIISASGGEVVVAIIKSLVQRPRPPSISALVLEHSFSFPSGHTFIAFSFYGLLAYIIYHMSDKKIWKIIAIVGGIAIIGAISFSRVYLGVHWPSDVLASFTLGAAWLTLLITILELQKNALWNKETAVLIGKKFIIIPTIILLLSWFAYIGYFFETHPLTPQIALIQNPIQIHESDIPNSLFNTLPRSSQTLGGSPMNPINIVVVGNYEELVNAFESAGWVQPESITLGSSWRNMIASIFNRPYPRAIETPAFWNSHPNDFAFQLPTVTIRQRHHIHFWATPLLTDHGHRVWFATAHFDKAIKLKTIIPTHTIDPYVDNERNAIKDDIVKTGEVTLVNEFQVIDPGQGKNQSGDAFVTDGKAFVLFLKDDKASKL